MAIPLLTDHIATRIRSLDFSFFGMLLPNPDPILKAQGKDIDVYRSLRGDALVGGSIRRRKSAVKALQHGLDKSQTPARVARAIEDMLKDMDLQRIIGQMQESAFYGYQPVEVMWSKVGSVVVPSDLVDKPPEWFCFSPENELRFKTRVNPVYGEALPERKFLLPRQEPTYLNPYGFPDLSMCFWPVAFRKGGMKFWLSFAEKFGSAWPVGKLPRSATDQERASLLDNLEALVQDGVAVIPDDGSIDLVEVAGKTASSDLYEKLLTHCRGEISIALLGQNQTTEASSNKASATAGLEVTDDLRDGDAAIVASAFNKLLRWVCEINWPGATPPTFSLWDQEARDKLQASRDKSNYEAGARFTNAYWMRAYNYQEGDLAQPNTSTTPAGAVPGVAPGTAPLGFADPGADTADPVQPITDAAMQDGAPALGDLVGRIEQIVSAADSLAQAQQALLEAYGDLDTTELQKIMAAAFALAALKGVVEVKDEAASHA